MVVDEHDAGAAVVHAAPRVAPASCSRWPRRDACVHGQAFARAARQLELAVQRLDALAHAHDAEARRLALLGLAETLPVVADVELDGVVRAPHGDFDARRVGMTRDVGEAFLHDAVDRDVDGLAEAIELAFERRLYGDVRMAARQLVSESSSASRRPRLSSAGGRSSRTMPCTTS
jgi:hypothetical protein